MDVAVGSTNPVKVRAVEAGLDRYELSVSAVSVDSDVAEQPFGTAETIAGAKTRAVRALDVTDAEYGIGLEGGVARLDDLEAVSLIMWAAVTDGDRTHCASGPSLELPSDVGAELEAGGELGPVMNDLLGRTDVAEREGAAGALTDGLTDRADALAMAVACAFGPFLTPYYR